MKYVPCLGAYGYVAPPATNNVNYGFLIALVIAIMILLGFILVRQNSENEKLREAAD